MFRDHKTLKMKRYIIKIVTITLLLISLIACSIKDRNVEKPKIAFSFDDGHSKDILHYSGKEWNDMIIAQLDSFGLEAIMFVQSGCLNNEKGDELLQKWNDKGHLIGNHTCNHLNYNDVNMSFEAYIKEIQICDSLISNYDNYTKIFRFPFLRAGNTIAKRDSMRAFLERNDYRQGWVTIDNSDWYINMRLIRRLRKDPKANVEGYKKFYINHVFEHAGYYNSLSKEINNREIPHTVLLHFNLTSALFLADLLEKFKQEGWELIDYSKAIKDPVYNKLPKAIPSDQSLIWSLAKKTGKYEDKLRYPGEDVAYEKYKMDSLGL